MKIVFTDIGVKLTREMSNEKLDSHFEGLTNTNALRLNKVSSSDKLEES